MRHIKDLLAVPIINMVCLFQDMLVPQLSQLLPGGSCTVMMARWSPSTSWSVLNTLWDPITAALHPTGFRTIFSIFPVSPTSCSAARTTRTLLGSTARCSRLLPQWPWLFLCWSPSRCATPWTGLTTLHENWPLVLLVITTSGLTDLFLKFFWTHLFTYMLTHSYALTHFQSALTYPSASPIQPHLSPPPQLVWEPVSGAHAPLEQLMAGGSHDTLHVPSLHDHLRRPPARESGLPHNTLLLLLLPRTHTSHFPSLILWDDDVQPSYSVLLTEVTLKVAHNQNTQTC